MTTPRVEYGLPPDTYRSEPGLSHSESKQLRKSPYHYKRLNEPRPPELVKQPTAQMALGTMVHVATLEPDAFDERYIVGPDISKNSNAWKAFAAACVEQRVEPITQLQRDQAFAMAQSVRALPDFEPLLAACATEVSMWWECPATGVLCKARPDLVKRYPPPDVPVLADADNPEQQLRAATIAERGFAILADLKTTESADAEAFARSVADWSYHTQAHWYSEGAEVALAVPVLSFLFVVVEREYPYAAASYTLDDNALAVARDINLAARDLFKRCEQTQEWPGYPRDTRDIALPPWYMKRYLAGLPV